MSILSGIRRFSKTHLSSQSDYSHTLSASESDRSADIADAVMAGGTLGVVGAGVGAGIGALVARSSEVGAYENSVEPTTVELSWQEPVMESQVLGRIPRDERLSPSLWNHLGINSKPTRINPSTEAASRTNPIIGEDGQLEMRDVTRVFEGHGTPEVSWASHRILNHELTGYDRSVTSRYTGQWSCQKNWFPPEDEELVEWCVDYKPKISKNQVGSYEEPSVKFDRPAEWDERISKATLTGALKGAGIGFVTGLVTGVLGSVLLKSSQA